MIGFALALAIEAVAEPPATGPSAGPFVLRWQAPAECPGAADVRGAIERHLAAPLTSPRGDGLHVTATALQRSDGRWNVELVVESDGIRSHRRIADALDCAAASETAALIIAIAIDPDVALRDAPAIVPTPVEPTIVEPTIVEPTTVEPSTVEPTTEATITGPAPAVAPATTPPPRPRPTLRAALGARADVTFGAHPRVGFGGTGFVDLLIGRVGRVGLGATISGGPLLAVGDATVRTLRWTIEARGCPVFAVRSWLEIVPCVGLQAGQTRIDVRGLANAQNPRNRWLAPTALLAAVFVPVPNLGIWLGAHGLVPIFPDEYQVEPRGRVYRTAPFAGGVLVGIEARLP